MNAPNPGLIYMAGHYSVRIAVQHFPNALVESWLPEELELAPQSVSPRGFHPANCLFGVESKVYFNVNPIFKFDYHEFGLVVPYIQWKQKKYTYNGPFLFTPIIFVDNKIVSLGGELVFGFPKRIAKFQLSTGSYQAFDAQVNTPYVRVEYKPLNSEPDAAARAEIRKCLQQPSVSQKADGTFTESGFWWNLDTASFADIDLQGEIIEYLLPGVASGSTRPVSGRGTSKFSEGAAYHMQTHWTLTLPTKNLNTEWRAWDGSTGLERF
jgi:hypothetical protein